MAAMLELSQFFSDNYIEARDKFLAGASKAGAEIESYRHPFCKGPEGGLLYTDVAIVGPCPARQAVFISSGVHGVEGFCGSACQTAALHMLSEKSLNNQLTYVLVHAVNPFGFAHLRRFNEDNVDINRNFADFRNKLPDNSEYALLHDVLVADFWDGVKNTRATRAVTDYLAQHGRDRFLAEVTFGQYTHPSGLFYGGISETWSNRTVRQIVASHLANCEQLIVLDIHTGLGGNGESSLIYMPGRYARGLEQSQKLFRDRVIDPVVDPAAPPVTGEIVNAFDAIEAQLGLFAPVTLEFGTFPPIDLLAALQQEQAVWNAKLDTSSHNYTLAKTRIRDAYYCDNTLWKDRVVKSFQHVMAQAQHALVETASG